MTETDILKRAKSTFAKQDALKAKMREIDAEILALCANYRATTKTWITRPESLRNAVEARKGRKAA